MPYRENPKTKGSGIICCIPQEGICPMGCDDCFFQSGRSYLEPNTEEKEKGKRLEDNLPNMPPLDETSGRIVRVNDGNDSSVGMEVVEDAVECYPERFYNTSKPNFLSEFDAPVVLTLNPAKMTDRKFHKVDPIPKNLMFVRIRTDVWNLETVVDPAVEYYSEREVPIVLTFMAYYAPQPQFVEPGILCPGMLNAGAYVFRKRTLNDYYAIRKEAWKKIMDRYWLNPWVYSCNKIEGVTFGCNRCGNCLREYYATKERIRGLKPPF